MGWQDKIGEEETSSENIWEAIYGDDWETIKANAEVTGFDMSMFENMLSENINVQDDIPQIAPVGDGLVTPTDWDTYFDENFDLTSEEWAFIPVEDPESLSPHEEGGGLYDPDSDDPYQSYNPWADTATPGQPWTGTYDPWAGWGQEMEDIEASTTQFWEDFKSDPRWTDLGGFEEHAPWFQEWEGSQDQHLASLTETGAYSDIENQIEHWKLLQSGEYDIYAFGQGAAEDMWQFSVETEAAKWEREEARLNALKDDRIELHELSVEELERLRGEATLGWGLEYFNLIEQIGVEQDIYDMKAAELYRVGVDAKDLWTLGADQLRALNIDQEEIWNIERASLGLEEQATNTLYTLELEEYTRRTGKKEEIWNIRATDIARRKLGAETMWGKQKESLEKGFALSGSDIIRRGDEATANWAMELKGYKEAWGAERTQVEAGLYGLQETWSAKKAQVEYGLEGLQETWGTEKERLTYGTQAGLEAAMRGQSHAILKMGFATGRTGKQDVATEIREQYGMQVAAGEEELSRQLTLGGMQITAGEEELGRELALGGMQIAAGEQLLGRRTEMGSQRLLQAYAGLENERQVLEENFITQMSIGSEQLIQAKGALKTEWEMGDAELKNTLDELKAAKDVSKVAYEEKIRVLSTKLGIGEQELMDREEALTRELELGDEKLDQLLEGYVQQGLINKFEMEVAKDAINHQIDIGSNNLSNVLAGLDAEEKLGLTEHNIVLADITAQIANGEITLDEAIQRADLTWKTAVDSGLIDYQLALDAGASAYEIAVGSAYEDLQFDLFIVMNNWMDDQEAMLQDIIEMVNATSQGRVSSGDSRSRSRSRDTIVRKPTSGGLG